ncbi:CDP-diacylglycerol--glycerol-3-phosphate 3-phosphatidyltransferase [Jannaschia pohangensis]|uniref:CDP-diacylglycerol--glycerol-3-phosphate 3-phosphatidyltransferase n=2 Tax=Jannaschia pohangensis TaxID=390807 RepID=A0A1I3JU92_9RHOB|nr:CDP-diacylglycerol--glycerol-3-phosphate 3-phosphatidyltransferase [Jannaschia pohangensis]
MPPLAHIAGVRAEGMDCPGEPGYIGPMRWTVPNMLTVLRLLAAPGVAIMFLFFARPWADWFALVLFVVAAVTDWFDGYLAREWQQETRFGAMLDPIADKAMVVIALLVITGFSGMNPWILLPATVILFREVFVSGLREFLGNTAGLLKVTKLAKWKTTAQMVAIAVLFGSGVFEHEVVERTEGMDQAMVDAILTGSVPDEVGLLTLMQGEAVTFAAGVLLLWIAALLTAMTGWDYFVKAKPYLADRPS